MLKTIIIDDEEHCRSVLFQLLKKHCPSVEVVAKADSALSGLNAIVKHQPDLVFLDVEMPGGNGFDLLSSLTDINFELIFTTAFDQYAMNAIKFSALDYLLKPINHEELKAAVAKVEKRHPQAVDKTPVKMGAELAANKLVEKIAIPTTLGLKFVDTHRIIRCESSNSYTFVHLDNRQKMLVSRSLKDFDELLAGHSFYRVHQSHLINLEHVEEYQKTGGGTLIMSDQSEILISKRKKDEFLKALNNIKI